MSQKSKQRRIFLLVLLICTFCLPSNGQIREIFDNGEIVEYYGGLVFETLGESIYSYRFVYGRYPEDKQALLDFQRDQSKVEAKEDEVFHGQHLLNLYIGGEYYDDSRYTGLIAKRDSLIAVDLNDPGNVLTVTGDTCTFTYAKATRESYYFGLDDPIPGVKLRAIQCIGGPADLQKKDYRSFLSHIRTLAYDKNGKWLWPLCSDAPYSPDEVRWKYNFVVSRDPGDYPDGRGAYGLARPVLIPFTITRSGTLSYDVSCLDGMQLYYRTDVNSTADSIDTIAIEDAIDPDYLDALKTYTKVIFDEHEEVDSVKLWELVYFNNLPKRYISFRDGITELGVYEIDRVDTLPMCNGVPFTEGFLPEFLRRFHPEPSDDNPYQFSVKFVIDTNGKLVGPRVKTPSSDFYKSSDNQQLSAYEKHVLETVNQIQNWEPGKVDGAPVNVLLTVPIILTDGVPKNVARTGDLTRDPSAIVFVVDGCIWVSPDFTYDKLGPIEIEAVLDRFVEAVPFISKEDIDSFTVIKSEEWSEHGFYFQVPKDNILITTKKESQIKTFVLNGKPTKRRRGIALGVLLDEELLKQQIQKKWRIKADTITGITMEGKTISITAIDY